MTILVCCILALSALTARAADDAGARMVSSVTFVVNGSDIDASYGRNAESLDRIRCFLDSIARDSFPAITSIEYAGYASPEGPAAANVMLARKRMAALEDFVMTACVVPLTEDVSRMYEVKGMSSLAEVIEKSDIAHREEAMKILGDETRSDEVKINRLRRARGGRIWRACASARGVALCFGDVQLCVVRGDNATAVGKAYRPCLRDRNRRSK